MKRFISNVLFICLLLVAFSLQNISAQNNKGWTNATWSYYGIDFSVPKDFKITQNGGNSFTASGSIFTMSIKPWKDAKITEPVEIAKKAYKMTPGDDKVVEVQKAIENLHGFNGFFAYGTATQKGNLMHLIVAGFLNPANETNFTVQILFWDNSDYNQQNLEAAMYILKSFKPNNLR